MVTTSNLRYLRELPSPLSLFGLLDLVELLKIMIIVINGNRQYLAQS